MIVKKKKYKYRTKIVDSKQEKQIAKLRRNQVVTEKVIIIAGINIAPYRFTKARIYLG